MDALIAAISASGNLAVVVLTLVTCGLFVLLREQGKEALDAQREMQKTLATLTEVITQLRVELASRKQQ